MKLILNENAKISFRSQSRSDSESKAQHVRKAWNGKLFDQFPPMERRATRKKSGGHGLQVKSKSILTEFKFDFEFDFKLKFF